MRWLLAALAALFAYTVCAGHTAHQHPYPPGIGRATINQQEGAAP